MSAKIVPIATAKGPAGTNHSALSDERMQHIAGLEAALRVALKAAQQDLAAGMPYLGTSLRLSDFNEIPPLVVYTPTALLSRGATGTK